MLEYVLRAVAVPGLNAQQQIEVTLECGLRCHRLGMWRKYALFLYIAALLSADNENFAVANALVRADTFIVADFFLKKEKKMYFNFSFSPMHASLRMARIAASLIIVQIVCGYFCIDKI